MATLKYVPQYFTTKLNVGGGINDSQTTGIVLLDVSGVDTSKPGQICVSYSDPLDTSIAEWIDYTSINGSNELVGAVRGREGYSAKTHLQDATVAFVVSASHHNDIVDLLNGTEAGIKVKTAIYDANGNEVIKTPATTNAVNEITVTNSATGNAVKIEATGNDTDISLNLVSKGAGNIQVNGSPVSSIISTAKYAPQGFLINGKIVPSVASNNLTVAIKGMDGNDPSASNPVYCRIGDTVRTITSALSVTKNAGTNWFNSGSAELATYETDYFVYLGYNATDGVVIGFARIPYASEYDDFSTTSTNEKYCAISTITNAASGDDYEVIGRFAATLSAGAGYTWSVPTFTNKNLIQRPIYETRRLFYKVNPTGYSTPATIAGFYKLTMTDCLVNWSFSGGTVGVSNSTDLTYPLPFTSANRSGVVVSSIGRNYNNGAEGTSGQCHISNNVSSATLFNGVAGGTWTAANGKFWEGQTIYQIA